MSRGHVGGPRTSGALGEKPLPLPPAEVGKGLENRRLAKHLQSGELCPEHNSERPNVPCTHPGAETSISMPKLPDQLDVPDAATLKQLQGMRASSTGYRPELARIFHILHRF